MKASLLIILFGVSVNGISQNKNTETYFNNFKEVTGTPYVIANTTTSSKITKANSHVLQFIDTQNGLSQQIDFPEATSVVVEQIKIDKLNINSIVVVANTIDLNGKKGIDWGDPKQLFIISVDGKEKRQLTDNHFFVNKWIINNITGTIIVHGIVDDNKNGKIDKGDKHRTIIYDLKSLALVGEL